MFLRPYRPLQTHQSIAHSTKYVLPSVYRVQQRRNFINQLSGINRIHRAQMGHDLKRVGTLVLLPPLIAASYITACGILGFVGTQVWLEYFAMRPGPSVQKQSKDKGDSTSTKTIDYGWNVQEDWSGGSKGGTDPSLGMLARIAIRSAWLFNSWAGQMGAQNVYSQPSSSSSPSYIKRALLGSTDRAHALAEQSLAWALNYIDTKNPEEPLPYSLLLRHADLLEHLATPGALSEARRELSTVYRDTAPRSFERTQLALRLGSLSLAEGAKSEAVAFWEEALALQRLGPGEAQNTPAEVRLIVDAYVQLSALYSMDSRLEEADWIQGQAAQALDFFAHEPDGKDPGSMLHFLYTDHRSNVLRNHRAEVYYAQTRDARETIAKLDLVASSAGGTARYLTLDPERYFDVTGILPTSPPESVTLPSPLESAATNNKSKSPQIPTFPPISPFLSSSKDHASVATALMRDSRRLTMQALMLEGMLLESTEVPFLEKTDWYSEQLQQHLTGTVPLLNNTNPTKPPPNNLTLALAAYEKAVQWAGTTLKGALALGIPEQEFVKARMRHELLRRRLEREKMMSEGRE